VDPAEQARAQVGRLAQLQGDRGALEAERQALALLIQRIKLDSAAAPEGTSPWRRLIGFPSLLRNQAASQLLSSLAALEDERSELLRRRTWLDADVQLLSARIAERDLQLKNIATTYLEGLTDQLAGLDQVGKQFGRALDSLPRKEVQTARLERDENNLQALYALMQTRLKDAEVTQAMQDPSVRIVERAYAASEPVSPKPKLNLALSLVLGCLLGLSVSLGRELSDRSVHSRADALHAAGLPVLGAIPRVAGRFPRALRSLAGRRKSRSLGEVLRRTDNKRPVGGAFGPPTSQAAADLANRLVMQPDSPGAYTEAFNQLQANLALAFQEHPIKVLVFTSALPGEGKTLSAINFALTAAARGKKVLLIDADTRCGLVNQVFGCSRQPGFTELLSGKARFEDGVRAVLVNENTTLAILPTGALLNGPSREMTVEKLRHTLTAIRSQFDMIVIDSPPVNVLADAVLLGAAADAVLLVVRAGKTQRGALSFAMDQLTAARAPVIGTVLNDIDLDRRQYDDGAYRYLAEVEKYHAHAGNGRA
jgi:capsular exopolysaccharide synthesis family protein